MRDQSRCEGCDKRQQSKDTGVKESHPSSELSTQMKLRDSRRLKKEEVSIAYQKRKSTVARGGSCSITSIHRTIQKIGSKGKQRLFQREEKQKERDYQDEKVQKAQKISLKRPALAAEVT